MSKAILVFGATGKQGSAVVRSLLAHPSFSTSEYTILAATRNVESAGAQRLAQKSPAIKLVKGDLKEAAATFAGLPVKPWGVYAMTMPGKGETASGVQMAEETANAGASHLVFSSVDRGVANDRNSPTDVPHFITKHDIEARIRQLAEKDAKFSYTIIRPPFFLDNFAQAGFFARLFATVWRDNCSIPMSVVDTDDIGAVAANAFLQAGDTQYHNTSLNIAGDRLTFAELDEKFKAKTGNPVPTTYSFFASLLLFAVHDIKMMAKFFGEPGFAAMPEESNKLVPMTSVDQWLDEKYIKKHSQ